MLRAMTKVDIHKAFQLIIWVMRNCPYFINHFAVKEVEKAHEVGQIYYDENELESFESVADDNE